MFIYKTPITQDILVGVGQISIVKCFTVSEIAILF